MILNNFKGYIEGVDITKIPLENLAYPSKNVIVTKGKVVTRGGIENDGVVATEEVAVHSEFVWKDALGGSRPIRVYGAKVQVKYNSKWYTIFTGLSATTTRVFFATWVDVNGSIYKKRLFFVDGSPNIYQWNGAIGVVSSSTSTTATLSGSLTGAQLGFDNGTATNQTLLHFIGSAVIANSEELQNNDPTAQDLVIAGTFNTTPIAGDVIIAKPVTFANEIASTYNIDAIYSFQNQITVASYDSVQVRMSHATTYSLANGLDFTVPSAGSRTALTATLLVLDGNFTAMQGRRNILWVSDEDDWYKVTKLTEENPADMTIEVEKFSAGSRKGALPMATAKYLDDIVYMAQDKTLQRITTDLLGKDTLKLLSDDIEALLTRLDLSDVRVYFIDTGIYIICPEESTMVILDTIEGYYQPPQILPISCMSVIDGVKYGHHNADNQTYILFTGRNDLDTPVDAVIAVGYSHGGAKEAHPFRYHQHSIFGMSCRLTPDTQVSVKQFFEETGAKSDNTFIAIGSDVKTYAVNDDVSWATHPYAERSLAGADMEVTELKRAMVFSKITAIAYFDWKFVMTISGTDNLFELLGVYIDDSFAQTKIGNDLFIQK